jgi:catechol 2,3-dioxygenase-like lactoylglutathione lyase family enzyme
MRPKTLDHVALWVADRDRIASFLVERLGLHVIDRGERFTLVGSHARHGKLTLFAAEGPREPGALAHVGLRVSDLALVPAELRGGPFEIAEGLRLAFVEAPTEVDFDLDHVALLSADPAVAAERWLAFGFAPAPPGPSGAPRVEVGGAWLELHAGAPAATERPLLNHVGVLVDSVEEHLAGAREAGIEADDVVDAPNTLALFVTGPEGVRLEYVEHKPSFSLV